MEVLLKIVEGPQKGQEFHFTEAENFLVGRDGPGSQAHLKLSSEDAYISRSHFSLEIRPPNVIVHDLQSANGTFIRRSGLTSWGKPITVAEQLGDGDQIRVGSTILQIGLLLPPTGETRVYEVPPDIHDSIHAAVVNTPEDGVRMRCIACNKPLAHLVDSDSHNFDQGDFMCTECRAKLEAAHAQDAARQVGHFECANCHTDLSASANQDHRAADLADFASYLCKPCAEKSRTGTQEIIGNYSVLRELGRGGMGIVYQVWHIPTGRVVALKQLLPLKTSEEMCLRFMREMSIMQDLRHPNLVRLIESGQSDRGPFFVSEFAPDGNLDQFIDADGRTLLSPVAAARLIVSTLAGLQQVHERGYVHRDIKPENILLRRVEGKMVPKLADFGLARSYEHHGGTITREGFAAGTQMYMPAEQLVDFRHCIPTVDIYAMGVTLYYLLTARFPLDFPPLWEIRKAKARLVISKDPVRIILEDEPKPIENYRPDVPTALAAVINKAIQKQARNRYSSVAEFSSALLASIS